MDENQKKEEQKALLVVAKTDDNHRLLMYSAEVSALTPKSPEYEIYRLNRTRHNQKAPFTLPVNGVSSIQFNINFIETSVSLQVSSGL